MVLNDAFSSFPRIETPRLLLRQLTKDDCNDVFAIFSDPNVTEYYDLETFNRVEEAEEHIERLLTRFDKRQAIRWGITVRPNDRVIGTCGVMIQSNIRGGLGYELARKYWRQGIMTEALSAVINFAFEDLGINRLEALVMPGNLASEELLRNLGFKEDGILREYAFYKGAFHDLTCFSILGREAIE